jgi:hypothetical protein
VEPATTKTAPVETATTSKTSPAVAASSPAVATCPCGMSQGDRYDAY